MRWESSCRSQKASARCSRASRSPTSSSSSCDASRRRSSRRPRQVRFAAVAKRSFSFTSESVTEGHPDKIADQISDSVLDAVIGGDPNGRVACETLITTGLVVVAGEITTDIYVDVRSLVRERISEIGYTRAKYGFDAETCGVMVAIDGQSPDIAQGVDQSYEAQHGDTDPLDLLGAGDQGMMYGYATRETEELMPLPIMVAHKLTKRLSEVRKANVLPYLRPDGKAQVTVRYEIDERGRQRPVEIERILISTQHRDGIDVESLLRPDLLEHVVEPIVHSDFRAFIDDERLSAKDVFFVNPTGKFVIGGPMGDTGLTGRKIVVDTYGGAAPHGGGAFSGKDPTKVDRSAAYAARYVAKNVVAAGLADRCQLQVAYAIGVARPLSLNVDCFGTEAVSLATIEALVREHFDLRPGAILRDLDLIRPIYTKTAAYGHFGREDRDFTWERVDKADALRAAAGLAEAATV
ncbi:MAG: methionine adenosyltransferase [Actinobacteria bacterium]|nr:MAG: methionine adenosyltransferase [Actinomycetota bacterium]